MFALAKLNIQTGAVDPAIEGLEAFLAKQPDSVQAQGLLGAAYLAKREPAKAVEEYRRVAAPPRTRGAPTCWASPSGAGEAG